MNYLSSRAGPDVVGHSASAPPVAILLSTRNGGAYLPDQLASFRTQTADWVLFWRDDGSEDATVAIMEAFAAAETPGRVVHAQECGARLGVTGSFLSLLRSALYAPGPPDVIAFADQDDVWLPEKVERGAAALRRVSSDIPALYCARQILVDSALNRISPSRPLRRVPGFPAALTQNVATGCTVMLNHAAAQLVAGSRAPGGTLHDWWCYLVVTAAGGQVILDDEAVVLYRQHESNAVGAPASVLRRGIAALRRGPGVFMRMVRAHVAALRVQPALLTPDARRALDEIDAALQAGPGRRLQCLRNVRGLYRQTWYETLLFRLWFMLG